MTVQAPVINTVIGGYDFLFDAQITVQVRRLSIQFGDVRGEITVSQGVTNKTHLIQERFNYSDGASRTKLASRLEYKLKADWVNILEHVCVRTLHLYRQGDPVIELGADDEPKPPEYYLSPFIIKNYPTVIFGDPGSAKSLVAQVLALMVLLPWYDNPLGLFTPTQSVKILYLDWETDKATIDWSMSCIEKGMGLGLVTMKYRRCFAPLHSDIEQIAELINTNHIDIVIVDSLGPATGDDLNATGPTMNFWNAWKELRTTGLILAHNAKNNDAGKKRSIYGNQMNTAQARCIWESRKAQEADSNEMDIALFNIKSPPFSKLHSPVGIHFSFEGNKEIADKIIMTPGQPRDIPELIAVMGTQAQILHELKREPLTTEELGDYLNLTGTNIRQACHRLKVKNQIINVGGKWGLLSK